MVDIITSNKVLGQIDNCCHQTVFTMVIASHLRDRTTKLTNLGVLINYDPDALLKIVDLYLSSQIALYATPHYFSLSGLQTIHYRGNGPDVICHREKNKFFIDEILDRYLFCVMI